MADDIKDALREATSDAYRLVAIVGALDALHAAMPATIHPHADEIGRRATNGLGELLPVMIERTEALAARLDRLAAGKVE